MRHAVIISCAALALGLGMATTAMAQPHLPVGMAGSFSLIDSGHSTFDLPALPLSFALLPRTSPAIVNAPASDRKAALFRSFAAQQDTPAYIAGPVLSYHAARGGPVLEMGALGGGMENTPFLAHVAVDWVF